MGEGRRVARVLEVVLLGSPPRYASADEPTLRVTSAQSSHGRSPTGRGVLTFESARTPLPVPAEARDSAIDVLRERAGEELDWSRIPTEMPVVEGITLDDLGRVWVRVNASDSLTVFDVYGRDGVYQGSAVTDITPPTYPVPSVVGDAMVAMVTDELGIPYVVRGRVREVR